MESEMRRLIIVVIVLMSTFYLASITLPVGVSATTLYVGGLGPGNYTSIQDAINAASPGDTIYVFKGTYAEHLEVDKPLSLVGEEREETVIDGMGLRNAVNITSDWVNITGFKVTGGGGTYGIGIYTFGFHDCHIENNNVSSNDYYGILLVWSNNTTVSNNVLWYNYYGLEFWMSSDSDIIGNIISSNAFSGIEVGFDSNNNTIAGNILSANIHGIWLSWGSNGNTVANNTVLSDAADGIYFHHVSSNIVINNTITSAFYGIHFRDADNNTATGNYVWNNQDGIALRSFSEDNTVANNTVISNNRRGINLEGSNNNTIHHNNIINNSQQAYDDRDTNQWDDGYPSGGNHWSDYNGADTMSGPNQDVPGGDGIGDTPYVIDADSEDRYPLVALVPRPPSAPFNLSAFSGDQQIALTWDPPSFNGSTPITNYRIYRGTAPGGEVFYAQVGNVLTHLDSGLTNRQMYCYRVSAVNAMGEGPMSNEACATPTTTPGAPIVMEAILSGNNLENVTIRWNLSSDDGSGQDSVVGYSIYRNTSYDATGYGYSLTGTVPSGTSEFVDSYVGEGDANSYFYRVCAVDLNNLTNCSAKQAGKFTRSVVIGPNLISVPLIQSAQNIETVLQTLKWDKAWTYDPFSQRWKSYTTSEPYKGELRIVNETQGLWVSVTSACNFTVAGAVPIRTTVHLSKGWNLVGFPSFQQDYTVMNLKVDVTAERVEGLDPSNPPYFLGLMLDGGILRTGYGYWLNMAAEMTWTVRNE